MAKHIRRPGDPSLFDAQSASNTSPIPQVGAQPADYSQPAGYVQPSAGQSGGQQGAYGQPSAYSRQDAYQPSYGNSPNASYVPPAGRQAAGAYSNADNQPVDYGQTAPAGYVPTQPRAMEVPVKKKRKHRFLKFLLFLIVAALVAVGAYLFMLNDRLGFSGGTPQDVVKQLADRVTGKPYYMLVLGSDSRSTSGAYGYSDIMMLIRIDEANKQLTMLSVPRDTLVYIDGNREKINAAYMLGGPSKAIEEVSKLTGVPISHYVEVDMSEFPALVDSLGGVEVEVPMQLTVKDEFTKEVVVVDPGLQRLNGAQASAVARARHEYDDSDAMRQNMVRAISMALLTSVLDRPVYEIPGAVMSAASFVSTDMDLFSIAGAVSSMATSGDSLVVYSGSGPTAGAVYDDGAWYNCENPEGWGMLMNTVDAGGDPNTVDADAYAQCP